MRVMFFIKKVVRKVYSKIMIYRIKRQKYCDVDGLRMKLSKNHMLLLYQKNNCYYDKVLPGLIKNGLFEKNGNRGGQIIDIGANIGDTLYSLIKHTSGQFLCIEPDADYYRLLEENVQNLEKQYRLRVKTINAFVVLDTAISIVTEKNKGTAHKICVSDTCKDLDIPKYTLTEIIQSNHIAASDIDLIKVDTDGYDWECITSFNEELMHHDILLYWENWIDIGNNSQLQGYIDMVHNLKSAGYISFFIFDNYGNYLTYGNDLTLLDLIGYLWRLNQGETSRTVSYFDVLSCKEKQTNKVREAINKFYNIGLENERAEAPAGSACGRC